MYCLCTDKLHLVQSKFWRSCKSPPPAPSSSLTFLVSLESRRSSPARTWRRCCCSSWKVPSCCCCSSLSSSLNCSRVQRYPRVGSYLRTSLLHQIYKKRYVTVEIGNLLLSDDFCLQLCVSKDIHRFLGVLSPSAWSMRLCLQALRMSTTFTELIFLSSLSFFLLPKSKLDWGSCSMLRFKYQLAQDRKTTCLESICKCTTLGKFWALCARVRRLEYENGTGKRKMRRTYWALTLSP